MQFPHLQLYKMQTTINNANAVLTTQIEKSDIICNYCEQPGHRKRDCPEVEAFLDRDERMRKELRYLKKVMNDNLGKRIKYACNPESFKNTLTEEERMKTEVREVELFCNVCNTCTIITEENILTLPEDMIINGFDKTAFNHSPIYSGKCLRPNCNK